MPGDAMQVQQHPTAPSSSLSSVNVQLHSTDGANGGDCKQHQHPQRHMHAKSSDAHRVTPDLRNEKNSEHDNERALKLVVNSDGVDNVDLQERMTMDTDTSSPVAAANGHNNRATHGPSHGDGNSDDSRNVRHDASTARTQAPNTTNPDRSSVWSADGAIWSIVQLVRPSFVLDKQIYMSVGALVLSFVLGACALQFRDAIAASTDMNAGLLLGSVGSLVMCSIVIATYVTTKWYRRHMHILLLNLATFDFLLALSFVLEPAWKRIGAGVGDGLSCHWLSIVREYLIMCSTAWTLCMALDLYALMTDPFTSPRLNRRTYQLVTHATASAAATAMAASQAFDAPVAVSTFCWVGAPRKDIVASSIARSGVWLFVVAPVAIAISANVVVTIVSLRRFRVGVAATLQTRHVLLREGFLTTVTLIVYATLLWGVYGASYVTTSKQHVQVLSDLFAFLLSYRGSVAFVLWCLYKRPRAAAVRSKQRKQQRRKHTSASQQQWRSSIATLDAESSSGGEASDDDSDDDAGRPQLNVALLQELVACTTEGIARAVRTTARVPTSGSGGGATGDDDDDSDGAACTFTLESDARRVERSRNKSTSRPVGRTDSRQFTAFRPRTFARLRAFFHMDDDTFVTALTQCTTPRVSEGASGAFVFYALDKSLVVKSLAHHESQFLLSSFLDAYVAYVTSQTAMTASDRPNNGTGHTFLPRFFGSYCIQLYGTPTHFVVMENVLDTQQQQQQASMQSHDSAAASIIHQRYDIKGSWIDRNAQKPARGTEATCRYCHLTFRVGSRRSSRHTKCRSRIGGGGGRHEPNIVLKDMDLTSKLRIGKQEGVQLVQQLKRDSDFLCDQGVTDYSLLLGVMDVCYYVHPPQQLRPPAPAATTSHSRTKQSTQCLRTSEVVIGPGVYYIGLIDILQTWSIAKRVERVIKTLVLRKDADGISAMAPGPYRTRFHSKLDEIVDVEGYDTEHASALSPHPHRGGSDAELDTD